VKEGNISNTPAHRFAQLTDPEAKQVAESMHKGLTSSLQALCVPVPNKSVEPGQEWKGGGSVFVGPEGQTLALRMTLTCTYEGCRTRQGRKEAVIRFEGTARAIPMRGDPPPPPGKRVQGTAVFDIEGGYYSKTNLTLLAETNSKGTPVTAQLEFQAERAPVVAEADPKK
jgi:hypothetical protein